MGKLHHSSFKIKDILCNVDCKMDMICMKKKAPRIPQSRLLASESEFSVHLKEKYVVIVIHTYLE